MGISSRPTDGFMCFGPDGDNYLQLWNEELGDIFEARSWTYELHDRLLTGSIEGQGYVSIKVDSVSMSGSGKLGDAQVVVTRRSGFFLKTRLGMLRAPGVCTVSQIRRS